MSPVRTAIAALLLAIAAAAPAADGSLRATLDRHLAAINARDLDALLDTITHKPALTTILPNGQVLETREEYRKLHVEWFAERDWRMVFDVQDVREFGDVGIARVKYDSQARNAAGGYDSQRIALLSLAFTREDGEWRLVYDQNTVVLSPGK